MAKSLCASLPGLNEAYWIALDLFPMPATLRTDLSGRASTARAGRIGSPSRAASSSRSPAARTTAAPRSYTAPAARLVRLSPAVHNGTTFSALIPATGVIFSAPSCAALAVGRVVCAARNSQGGLVASVFDGAGWVLYAPVTVARSRIRPCLEIEKTC